MKFYKFFIIPLLIILTSCASGPDRDPGDPLEPLNRAIESFNNDLLDQALLKPIAELYNHIMPNPIIESINNFFNNLGEVVVFTNDLLQGKFQQGLQDSTRFVYNTTFGLGGLFDVATAWDLPRHNEDFGQTLGYWGVGPGPYLVLPFVGPRTVRDTLSLVTDYPLDPTYQINSTGVRNSVVALRVVDTRTNLLGAGRVLNEAALDRYLFLRDAYLQRRESLVHDGKSSKSKSPPG
ncbi:phospholipid-binding lipoprotein MlaA [Gammaproteobacteria bacterium]